MKSIKLFALVALVLLVSACSSISETTTDENRPEDPVVQDRAQQLVNTYRQYFPPGDDVFFHGYSEGDPCRAGCWINRTTTISARQGEI